MKRNMRVIIVIGLLVLGGIIWAWNPWVTDLPEGPGTVLLEASYQHPVVSLTMVPEEAAMELEVTVEPELPYKLERFDGQVDVMLEDWEHGQKYTLSASLPEQDFVLELPYEYQFQTPEEMAFDLVAVGDVMLDQLTRERLHQYDTDYPLAKIRQITQAGELVFANLEAPLSDRGQPADKKYVFRAHPRTVEVLKNGGFNLVSLANNHVLDYGPQALMDTMEILDQQGISHVGAGADEEQARRGEMLDINGLKVGVLAYTRPAPESQYPAWAATSDQAGTLFHRDRDAMLKDVQTLKSQADLVIVSMHWGNEYTHEISNNQQQLGRLLVDNGVDLVLGHHAHAPQGIEIYQGKPIVYSLGNFVFYPFSIEICNETFILQARLDADGVKEMRLLPVLLGDSQPYVPEDDELERLQQVLGGLLADFDTEYFIQGSELVIPVD